MLAPTNVTEHIPTNELKELFQSQTADFCPEDALEPLIQLSHQIIHKAVLQPRQSAAADTIELSISGFQLSAAFELLGFAL